MKRSTPGLAVAAGVIVGVVALAQADESTLHTVIGWTVVLALPGAVVFPALYATARRWYATHLGRALFISSSGLGMVVALGALRVLRDWPDLGAGFAGQPAFIDMLRSLIYLYLLFGIYYMIAALIAVRRRGTDLHRDDNDVRHTDSV